VPAVFQSVNDQNLQNDFRTANDAAIKAMKDFDAWLGSQEASATDNFALGTDKFREMLKATERVDVPLDQLEEIGRKIWIATSPRCADACNAYARPDNPAVHRQSAGAKPQGASVVDAARTQLNDLKAFINERISSRFPARKKRRSRKLPYALELRLHQHSRPLRKGLASTYYISPPDPAWSKESAMNMFPAREVCCSHRRTKSARHFLQFLHANRSSKFGQVFVGYAFAEGWAHYKEMMYDAGLGNGDPKLTSANCSKRFCETCVSFRHRDAHQRHERRRFRKDVSGRRLSGRWQLAATGRARHVRSRLP
jgi:hypothetical protein